MEDMSDHIQDDSKLQVSRAGELRFSLPAGLSVSDEDLRRLVEVCGTVQTESAGGLLGRRPALRCELSGIGTVVVKHYARGGALRKFLGDRYLRTAVGRAESEFRMLERLKRLGLQVPDAVGFAEKGGVLRQHWLFTREIPGARTMAEVAVTDGASALENLLPAAADQVQRLIGLKVHHVDLHPGNVLVGADGQVYLIDFDKAVHFSGPPRALREQYLCRWRRAVIKHRLPPELVELFAQGLLTREAA